MPTGALLMNDKAFQSSNSSEYVKWLDATLREERLCMSRNLEARHAKLIHECTKRFSQMSESDQGNGSHNSDVEIVARADADAQLALHSGDLVLAVEKYAATKDALAARPAARVDPALDAGNVVAIHERSKACSGESKASNGEGANQEEPNDGLDQFMKQQPYEKKRRVKRGSKWQDVVEHPFWEMGTSAVLLANMIVMAVEVQSNGFQLGRNLDFKDFDHELPESVNFWAGMQAILSTCDYVFGVIYTLELFFKIFALRVRFFYSFWNILDVLIVLGWYVDIALQSASLPIDLLVLRLARLCRLVRVIKLVKTVRGFDSLYLMTTSIRGSISVLCWTFFLLFLIQILLALLLNQVLVVLVFDDESRSIAVRRDCFRYFGTFARCMLTMFEITLGNWVPVARFLAEDLSMWFVVFSIFHKLSIGFAVIGVINGVFISETFKTASQDDAIMLMMKKRLAHAHAQKMHVFFENADMSEDGWVDKKEFNHILKDPEVRHWLAAQEIDVSDADLLFHHLARNDVKERISAAAMVSGVAKLKGTARNLDVLHLSVKAEELEEKMLTSMSSLQQRMTEMTERFDDLVGAMPHILMA
eukprot:TRINITY_DN24068_c0_g1_i2.p1 TRINITY_DN24068_c0_g1~~TRINITY_DN24068_c0_g1_i2.p1  ORF type:complete len:605 (-),score=105.63 TRINITY_DN24068_c0_g1_i2:22-1791(-)